MEIATTVLGREIALPVIAAPTGLTGLTHPDGEMAAARAAHAAGSIYTLSTMASYTLEEVAEAAPGPKWFQLYVMSDRGLVDDLLSRARAAGYEALMLTVDVQVAGVRERDVRNRFSVPPRITARTLAQGIAHPRWSAGFLARPRMTPANLGWAGNTTKTLASAVNRAFDPTVTWDDLADLRERWTGPLLVKGIMRADDAERCVEHRRRRPRGLQPRRPPARRCGGHDRRAAGDRGRRRRPRGADPGQRRAPRHRHREGARAAARAR